MNDARKSGLLAMAIFGTMFVAVEYTEFHWVNETSGFGIIFGGFLLGFAFLMGFVQFVTGEFPS
jgi:hypothetical protein